MTTRARFEILNGEDDALRRFLNAHFRYQVAAEEFRHLVRASPDGPARFYVLRDSAGDFVASYGVLPVPAVAAQRPVSLGLATYLAVRQDERSPALFADLSAFAFACEADAGTVALFGPPNPMGYRAHRFLAGWEDVTSLAVVGITPGAHAAGAPALCEVAGLGSEHLPTVAAEAEKHAVSRVRHLDWLRWRYAAFPNRSYRCFEWRDGGVVRGCAVVKHWREEGGLEKVHVMDAFARAPEDMVALLRGITGMVQTASEVNAWGDVAGGLVSGALAAGFVRLREQPLIAKRLGGCPHASPFPGPVLFTYGDADGY